MTNLEATQPGESLCVFQIGDVLFALSATDLREVALRPQLANIPNSHSVLAGLWHEGSEFLPVLRLPTRNPLCSESHELHMLVVSGSQSAWGLLVDRIRGIERLEVSTMVTESIHDDWSMAQIGTSKLNGQLVRILNAEGIYRLIEQILNQHWALSRDTQCGSDQGNAP